MSADLALFRAYLELHSVRWPAGALDACLDLMRRFPAWRVTWHTADPRYPGSPPLYIGTLDVPYHSAEARSWDPDVLAMKMRYVPEHDYSLSGCAWCYSHLGEARPVLL